MADVIFLDTNQIANKGANAFFGQVDSFKRIASLAQVYIPSIVMEEIKHQKRRELESLLSSFKSNYFSKHLACDFATLDAHIEEKIEALYADASAELDYIELDLKKDPAHIDTLKLLALKNHPPFERGSDKGMKDAYVYLTIIQYLEENASDFVFLFTKDGRLKDSFEKNGRVRVLSEPDEYFSYGRAYFKGDYFLGVLSQGFLEMQVITAGVLVSEMNVGEITITDDDDWVIEINLDGGGKFDVLVDFFSKEIIEIIEK